MLKPEEGRSQGDPPSPGHLQGSPDDWHETASDPQAARISSVRAVTPLIPICEEKVRKSTVGQAVSISLGAWPAIVLETVQKCLYHLIPGQSVGQTVGFERTDGLRVTAKHFINDCINRP